MKLALLIHHHGIDVALNQRRGLGWACTQRIEQPWRDDSADAVPGEQLGVTLRPLLLAWGVKPGTPVLMAANNGLGGILCGPLKAGDTLADAVDALIASQVPHQRNELACIWQTLGTAPNQTLLVQWLPHNWLNEVRDTLTRMGLRLEEVYPVSRLLVGEPQMAKQGRRLRIIQTGNHLGLWAMRPSGEIDACAQLDIRQPALASRLALALLGLGVEAGSPIITHNLGPIASEALRLAGHAAVTAQASPDLPDTLFRRWLAGDAGWWQAPPREWLLARITPLLIGAALVLIGSVAYLGWDAERLAEDGAKLDAAAEKMRPTYRRLDAKQRDLLHMRATLIDAETFHPRHSVLDALAAMTAVLPEGAVLTHYHADAKAVFVEGKGSSNASLIAALSRLGWDASSPAEPASKNGGAKADNDVFKLELHERPAKAH